MSRLGRNLAAGLAGLAVLCAGGASVARALTLDDLLATEEFGQAAFDPTGHWAVIEQLSPYDQLPRYDLGASVSYLRPVLKVMDVSAPGPARPLLRAEPGVGYTAGPFSPDGRAMIVHRLIGRSFETGVVTLPAGEARWLGLTPELPLLGRSVIWRSPLEIVMIARDDLPSRLRWGWQATERLSAAWARMAEGEASSMTAYGAGAQQSLRPKAPRKRVVRVNLRSGAVTPLAEADAYDLELSPDGRRLAVALEAEDIALRADTWLRTASPVRRRGLLLIDLATGDVATPCPTCDLATHLLSWSPASDALLVFSRPVGAPWAEGRLLRVSAVRNDATPLATEVSPELFETNEGFTYVQAGWMGGDPVLLGRLPGAARADWHRLARQGPVNLTFRLPAAPEPAAALEASSMLLAGEQGVWRVGSWGAAQQLSATPVRPIAPRGFGDGDRQRVNPLRGPAGGLGLSLGDRPRFGPLAEGIGGLTLPEGSSLMAATAEAALVRQHDSHGVLTARLVTRSGATDALVLNRHLTKTTPPEIRPLRHRDRSGRMVTSWLYRPADAGPQPQLPLVVLPYPGVVRSVPPELYGHGGAGLTNNPALLAAAGYAALVPSLPRDRTSTEPADGLTEQILAVVDLAIADGGVDPNRIAVWGHSFGGYTALTLATRSDRFGAVIASAAPSNLTSMRGVMIPQARSAPEDGYELTFGAGWTEAGQGHLLATPWGDPDRYVRNSPLFAADRISAPVMLIHGDQDYVSFTQSQELFAALHRQHKDATLLTFWGEGHVLASPANIRELYRRALGFLRETIGDRASGPDPSAP